MRRRRALDLFCGAGGAAVGYHRNHDWQTPRFPQATNRANLRRTVEVGAYRCHRYAPSAMGIDWMTGAELTEAIPPVYTEFLGRQIHAWLRARADTLELASWA